MRTASAAAAGDGAGPSAPAVVAKKQSILRSLSEADNAGGSGRLKFVTIFGYTLREYAKLVGCWFGAGDMKVWYMMDQESAASGMGVTFLSRPEGDTAVKKFATKENLYKPSERRAGIPPCHRTLNTQTNPRMTPVGR